MCHNPAQSLSETDRFAARGGSAVAVRDDVNLAGLDDLLRTQQLDAIVCRGGLNVTYLSAMAMPGTLGRHLDLAETDRPVYVLWPAAGDPELIVSEIASELAQSTARIETVRTYADYVEPPEAALADELKARGLAKSRIGFDAAWFGANRWSELNGLLPDAKAVDCTDALDLVRAVKTPAEVARLREAATLLDRVLADVFPSVRAGQTERDVNARIVATALELGADGVHGILQSSSNTVLYGGESDQRLQDGDLLRTDYVLYLNGYAANLSRPLHVGGPSARTQRLYRSYAQICSEAVALLRPGTRGGDLHHGIQELFIAAGWTPGPAISGHGIGRWFHQQRPMLVSGSSDVLQAGMVIALEPISGHWHLQDEFLITEGDPVRISDTFEWEALNWTA